jgi:hypothetical protein
MEALVQLIGRSQDPGVCARAVEAIAIAIAVAIHHDSDYHQVVGTRQQAADAGAVEALVQLISNSSQDPKVLLSATYALIHICCGDSSAGIKQRAAAAGAVEALVQRISSSQKCVGRQQAPCSTSAGGAQTSSSALRAQGLQRRCCSSSSSVART